MIKPCPLCGLPVEERLNIHGWMIECSKCKLILEAKDKKNAREKWNERKGLAEEKP